MKPSWNVCLEIGLNHLGSVDLIFEMLESLQVCDLGVAVTVQVREESFYRDGKESLLLKPNEYQELSEYCRTRNVPFGFALGPLKNMEWICKSGIKLDFLKILYMATLDHEFLSRVNRIFDCKKYFSTGMSDLGSIKKDIVPLMSTSDGLVHTSLSFEAGDQSLNLLSSLDIFN